MRGVRKVSVNRWIADYSSEKTGKLKALFDSEEEAIYQRKKWESEHGLPKKGASHTPKSEILAGTQINKYTVIGDTGKRDVNGGAIALVRHEDGQYQEIPWNGLVRSNNTGYVGSEEHKKRAKNNIKKVQEKFVIDGSYLPLLAKEKPNTNSKTGYRGVSWSRETAGWVAVISYRKQRIFRFFSHSFEEAVLARNRFFIENINPLLIANNLKPIEKISHVSKNDFVLTKEKNGERTSRILKKLNRAKKAKGVYYIKNKDRWVAERSFGEKPKAIGTFKTEQQALEARKNYVKTVIEPQIKQLTEEINNDI